MEEQDIQNVTIEEVAEEEAIQVETTTEVTADLVHVLAGVSARKDTKRQKKQPLYYALAVVMFGLAIYWAYTYFITKTGTRGPVMIALMLLMGTILIRYLRTPPQVAAERRMSAFIGQKWHYVFDDEGIHMVNQGRTGTFHWGEVTCWWQEGGYILAEIGGQALAVLESSLEEDELAALKSLLYIYLGEAKQENA